MNLYFNNIPKRYKTDRQIENQKVLG